MTRVLWFILLALKLPVATLFAHSGHDFLDQGAVHVVTSPYHLAILGLLMFACLIRAVLADRPVVKRLFGSLGLCSFVAMILLWPAA